MMSRRNVRLLVLLLLLAPGSGCARAPQAAEPLQDEVTLHVLLTADLHGQLRPEEHGAPGGGPPIGIGGPAILGGHVGNLRRQAPRRVVLLDAGDAITGSLEADTSQGRAVVETFGLLGYDALALGNHEFDFGREVLLARAAQAPFPLLAANVLDASTGKRWEAPGFQASVLLERSGVLVGVVGLASTETPSTTKPSHVEGLVFQELAPTAEAEARRLRAQGAQVVVILLHDGGICRSNEQLDDLSSCDTDAPIFRLARELPPGTADLLAGGHTHGMVAKRVHGVPVVVPGWGGRWLGQVDLVVSRSKGRVLPERTVVHPLLRLCQQVFPPDGGCLPPREAGGPGRRVEGAAPRFAGAEVRPDPAVERALAPVLAAVEQMKHRPLGVEAATSLTRAYDRESELGNLVCDALLWAVPEAQVSMTNAGGIRAEVPPGPITFGEIYQVLPFDNRLALLRLSGAQLRELLAIGLDRQHGMAQVGGLKLVGDVRQDRKEQVVEARLLSGAAIDPGATYTVVTTDYLATGGSGFDRVVRQLPPAAVQLREDKLRDVVIAYLEEQGRRGLTIDPPERPLLDPARPRIRLVR